jgi:hypothetical protein
MQEVQPDRVTARALADYEALGGVLDYVLLRTAISVPAREVYRDAALAGIAVIDRRLKERAPRFRLTWDAQKLKGNPTTFATF